MAGQNSKKLQCTKCIIYVKSSNHKFIMSLHRSSPIFTDLHRSSYDKSWISKPSCRRRFRWARPSPPDICCVLLLAQYINNNIYYSIVILYVFIYTYIIYTIIYIHHYILKLHCYTLACCTILHLPTMYIYLHTTHTQTDRQTDRRTDRQTDKQTDRPTYLHT